LAVAVSASIRRYLRLPPLRRIAAGLAAVVFLLVSGTGFARAQGAGDVIQADPTALKKAIDDLRREYLAKMDAGEPDPELRDLLRDLNAARGEADWNRVADLLALRATGAGGQGPVGDLDSLFPVRTGDEKQVGPGYTRERVTFKNVQGMEIGALLYRPFVEQAAKAADPPADPKKKQNKKKYPAVLLAHGGWRGVPLAYRRLARALAPEGYVVYAPEFRGQGRSEGDREYARGEVLDLLSALEVVKKLEDVDEKRIGLVGGEHGGAVVLLALARAEGISCAAAISAPTDLPKLVREVSLFRRELRSLRLAFALSDVNALRQRSPILYAAGVEAPVLVLHGGKGRLVPAGYAVGYEAVLKARGKDVTLVQYRLEGDDLVGELGVYEQDLKEFLARHLRPPKPQAPKKQDAGKGAKPKGGRPGGRKGGGQRSGGKGGG
jgi:dienelactone hydrolase